MTLQGRIELILLAAEVDLVLFQAVVELKPLVLDQRVLHQILDLLQDPPQRIVFLVIVRERMIGRELRAFRGEHVAEEINHRLNVFLAAFIGIERLLTLFGHGKLIGLQGAQFCLGSLAALFESDFARVVRALQFHHRLELLLVNGFAEVLPHFFVAISSHFVLIGPPACQSIGSRAELSLNSIDG